MNTTTQTATTTAPVTAKAAPKAKPVEVTAAWYAAYNATITNAKGALGTVPTADTYAAALLVGGAPGKPKRHGVEALFLALTLRPEGCSNADFVTIKGGHGFAQNCLHYASANLSRALYGWLHVSAGANGAHISRLTAKGAAMLKAAGIKGDFITRASKPYVAPAAAKPVKAAKPTKPAAQPKGASKAPAGTTTAAPATPTSAAPKPVAVPATQPTPTVAPKA